MTTTARDAAAAQTRPLAEDEVRAAAEAFAQAYETEDGRALRRLLAADVQRVLPGGIVRGRDAVATEYESQFRANATQSYELEDLDVRGGRAGRASGDYRVRRSGRPSIGGRIVLVVVRDRGRTRIALITVTPDARPRLSSASRRPPAPGARGVCARPRPVPARTPPVGPERSTSRMPAAALDVGAQAQRLEHALELVLLDAGELRNRHEHVARDAQRRQRRLAARRRGDDVDDVRARLERHDGAEAPVGHERRAPETVTCATAGVTRPRTSTLPPRTTASSAGAVICRRTGASAGDGCGVSSPPQPAGASSATQQMRAGRRTGG